MDRQTKEIVKKVIADTADYQCDYLLFDCAFEEITKDRNGNIIHRKRVDPSKVRVKYTYEIITDA